MQWLSVKYLTGSPTQTYDYREDSNAVESHAVKSG